MGRKIVKIVLVGLVSHMLFLNACVNFSLKLILIVDGAALQALGSTYAGWWDC